MDKYLQFYIFASYLFGSSWVLGCLTKIQFSDWGSISINRGIALIIMYISSPLWIFFLILYILYQGGKNVSINSKRK